MVALERVTLKALIEQHGILIEAKHVEAGEEKLPGPGKPWQYDEWRCRLYLPDGRELKSIPFKQGTGHRDRKWNNLRGIWIETPKPPSAYDVLYCMLADASSLEYADTFEEWASELGFDPDSRTAERTYHQCQEQTTKLRRWLGRLYQDFLEAEQE